ncbi:MAG: hypothetical protein CMN30_29190 [Sandaracinus sp.]|nr:hypothetical protein [Sandaracinus sp.]|tara:strand:- start:660 stop:1982 length:1323 start_codon:yes stop_codon:yes gene_type:complete
MSDVILVVEDDPDALDLVATFLRANGYEVVTAETGADALEAAVATPPSLVLMDVNLPEMDGFEACKQLKEDPALADVPVLFLTGSDRDEDVLRGFEVGGVDYLRKPVRPPEMQARVKTHLALQNAMNELVARHAALTKAYDRLQRSKQREVEAFGAVGAVLEGTTLAGRYELGEKLGEGGMGVVLAAKQTDLDREVAVKILRPTPDADRDLLAERFAREGQASVAVTHPNAITIHEMGLTDTGLPYLVMERLHGRTLAQIIDNEGKLELWYALHMGATVADVLAVAHEVGVVHRDVNPSNIFFHRVGEGDMVKVLDFGIAKLLGRAKTKTLTQGDFLGTPGYIAPETYADANRELTGKADVYGLGAVLFEAVSGQEPIVTAANPMVTLSSHLFTPPRRLRELAPEASPELEDLVARMLAKEPDARPTAREACEAMRAMLG